MKINRRSALGMFGSGAILPAFAAEAAAPKAAFLHGVASGDPTTSGAILWTRVTPDDAGTGASIPVRWHVAASEGGTPVESGAADARGRAISR
jgi:alkaline phosphatase D